MSTYRQRPGDPRPGVDLDQLRAELVELQRKVARWEAGSSPTTGTDLGADPNRLTVFAIMPFGPQDLQFIYQHCVIPALNDLHMTCVRGDDMFGSEAIMDNVLSAIDRSDLVVADLTGQNANVFYEVGISHAKAKPVLLMAQSLDDVPFDLRHRRILIYEYSPPGVMHLIPKLKQHLQAMVSEIAAS